MKGAREQVRGGAGGLHCDDGTGVTPRTDQVPDFTCFTSTKVQVLKHEELSDFF